MKFFSVLVLTALMFGCASEQQSPNRKTAQATPRYFTEEGFAHVNLSEVVVMNNNTRANDLSAKVGVVKELDEWLGNLLRKETGADKLLSNVFSAPANKDGIETYVVVTKVMTNFNLNVVTKDKKGKINVVVYEIVNADKGFLEVVKNAQTNPEGYTVIGDSKDLFGF